MLLSPGLASTGRFGRAVSFVLFLGLILLTTWPDLAKSQSAEEGRAIYERRCSVCHGDHGGGAYWASDSLDPSPRDFRRTDAEALSREAMIDAVAHGRKGTAMTAWHSRLSSRQIAAVVDFIRAEFMSRHGAVRAKGASDASFPGGLKGNAAKGGVFFHANCAECHGHRGDGRGRRADFMVYKPLDFTSPKTRSAFDRARLYASTSRGVPGTAMPAWSKVLNNQQIADVAEYVLRAFIQNERTAEISAAPGDKAADVGRRTYLRYCSYCHGYKGDGRTAAAHVLDPKPRDFTGAQKLSFAEVSAAVREGRKGTAMPSFAKVLSEAEIMAVAEYVTQSLAGHEGEVGRYHTAKNGWPEHDARYGPAIPFARGELAVDAALSTFTPTQRRGFVLFRDVCVSCHFGKHDKRVTTPVARRSDMATDYTNGPHDAEPEIAELTPTEAKGRRLYQVACAQCHAADGTGKNWIGRFLSPSPTDFNTPKFKAILSSDAFVTRTLRAPDGTSMPSFEQVLNRAQVEAIAAYARRAFQAP